MKSDQLEKSLCFPLYAAAKEVIRQYAPLLESTGLTYTQYITMTALWEYPDTAFDVGDLGSMLCLDSGTLTPLLKRLESKGYIVREAFRGDRRHTLVRCTDEGLRLKDALSAVPERMQQCCKLDARDAGELCRLLHLLLDNLNNQNKE
ncbi:MAG: MarR family transcriptional regulator [Clostridia bacterium]|nr:MarR family transcriptional regulator [Clostridia bacterium]MBR0444959.1 MarR family transcriptional regulator [Clostridia bacterium]